MDHFHHWTDKSTLTNHYMEKSWAISYSSMVSSSIKARPILIMDDIDGSKRQKRWRLKSKVFQLLLTVSNLIATCLNSLGAHESSGGHQFQDDNLKKCLANESQLCYTVSNSDMPIFRKF